MKVLIEPLRGIIMNGKDITFGMTQQQVEEQLGPPTTYQVNNLIKHIYEPRNGAIFKYENGLLFAIEISVGSGLSVLYKDIDLFNDKGVVSALSVYDAPTPSNGKYINFYKLGILLGGFGKKRIPEKKTVVIFPEDKIEHYKIIFKIGGGKM